MVRCTPNLHLILVHSVEPDWINLLTIWYRVGVGVGGSENGDVERPARLPGTLIAGAERAGSTVWDETALFVILYNTAKSVLRHLRQPLCLIVSDGQRG